MATVTIGVLALQGAFVEHIRLIEQAAAALTQSPPPSESSKTKPLSLPTIIAREVRTPSELAGCDALILPGGESTSMSLIAERTGLLEPLRDFIHHRPSPSHLRRGRRRPVWGTCAGLILLADAADRTRATGQALLGGLGVRVRRNYFGRQAESFEADLPLPFLADGGNGEGSGAQGLEVPTFHAVFIRAPVVAEVLRPADSVRDRTPGGEARTFARGDAANDGDGVEAVLAPGRENLGDESSDRDVVEILGRLPSRARVLGDPDGRTAAQLGEAGDIVAVRQGHVFGTAFHPELTGDARIHVWWLREVLREVTGDDGDTDV